VVHRLRRHREARERQAETHEQRADQPEAQRVAALAVDHGEHERHRHQAGQRQAKLADVLGDDPQSHRVAENPYAVCHDPAARITRSIMPGANRPCRMRGI